MVAPLRWKESNFFFFFCLYTRAYLRRANEIGHPAFACTCFCRLIHSEPTGYLSFLFSFRFVVSRWALDEAPFHFPIRVRESVPAFPLISLIESEQLGGFGRYCACAANRTQALRLPHRRVVRGFAPGVDKHRARVSVGRQLSTSWPRRRSPGLLTCGCRETWALSASSAALRSARVCSALLARILGRQSAGTHEVNLMANHPTQRPFPTPSISP